MIDITWATHSRIRSSIRFSPWCFVFINFPFSFCIMMKITSFNMYRRSKKVLFYCTFFKKMIMIDLPWVTVRFLTKKKWLIWLIEKGWLRIIQILSYFIYYYFFFVVFCVIFDSLIFFLLYLNSYFVRWLLYCFMCGGIVLVSKCCVLCVYV